jgi:hypothetical protein
MAHANPLEARGINTSGRLNFLSARFRIGSAAWRALKLAFLHGQALQAAELALLEKTWS